MKHKKLIISLGVVAAVMVVAICVVAFVFRLKTVDIEFRQRPVNTDLEQKIQEKVLKDGDFDFGKNILFMDFDKNIAKIEKLNPYVKVEQVIRYFPSRLGVYISERIPKFRVRDERNSTEWFVLDKEFKVLDKISVEQTDFDDWCLETIEIAPETLQISAQLGDFVSGKNDIKSYANTMAEAYFSKGNSFDAIKSISVTESEGEKVFTLCIFNCKIVAEGEEDLLKKFIAGVSYYFDHQESVGDGETIQVRHGEDGGYAAGVTE